MKRIFLTTATLILSVGSAAAEVSVSGDARFGLKYDDGHIQHTSRARAKFTLEEITDNGISFGAKFRADQAGDAKTGAAGTVYVSGNFGKISYGNNDSAALLATGEELYNISLVGKDYEDFKFFATEAVGTKNPNVLYQYETGNVTLYASLMDGDAGDKDTSYEDAWALGGKYSTDRYTVGLGHERGTYLPEKAADDKEMTSAGTEEIIDMRTTVSVEGKFDAFKIKGMYSTGESNNLKIVQYGGSGEYQMDDLKIAAYVKQQKDGDAKTDFAGIGASYDLSKHATIKGGLSTKKNDKETDSYADLGIALKF